MKNLLSKTLSIFGKKEASPFNDSVWYGNSGGNTLRSTSDFLGTYTALPYVSIAVDAIMRDAGGQAWSFFDSEDNKVDNVPEKILRPFINVNQGISFNEQIKLITGHRALSGNGLLVKNKNTAFGVLTGIPDNFTLIPPDKFKIILSPNGLSVSRYEVSLDNGASFSVLPEDVIHFRQTPMYNQFCGIGNVQKARVMIEGMIAGDAFQKNDMEKQGSVNLVIKDEEVRTPDDMDRIRLMLDKNYIGSNGKRILYMSGKGVDAKTLSISKSDLQFLENRKFDRDTVLQIFGVVPEAIGITEDSNTSTGKTQIARYHENINNILLELEDSINSQFVHPINPGINFKFKKHVTSDIERVSEMVQLGIITPKQASKMLLVNSDDDFKERDMFYIKNTLRPIVESQSQNEEEGGKSTPKKTKVSVKIKDPLMDPHNFDMICKEFCKSATKPKQFQEIYLRRSLETRVRTEDKYFPSISDMFEGQRKRVIKSLLSEFEDKSYQGLLTKAFIDDQSPRQVVDLIFNVSDEDEKLVKTLRPLHTSSVQRSILDINSITGSKVNESIKNPFVKAAIGRLGRFVVGGIVEGSTLRIGINEVTRKQLEKIVLKSVENGETIAELQTNINNKFNDFKLNRARTIARTESRIAFDAGSEVAYNDIGVENVDVVGCGGLSVEVGGDELNSDCGVQDKPISQMSSLNFHPNHIGVIVPSEEI
jgi:HK97 family phage portal protein